MGFDDPLFKTMLVVWFVLCVAAGIGIWEGAKALFGWVLS